MLDYEDQFYNQEVQAIVGVDEAGRGPLAGPVFAAAVILPPGYHNPGINDSKKLTAKKRDALFEQIKRDALAYGIASVDANEIDKLNIYEATKVCMKKAIAQLKHPYDMIITDCMPLSGYEVPILPLVKGDAKCENVAAASILAKVSRDRYMEELEKEYPDFRFSIHKGYGTKAHMEELKKYGPIEGIHRRSFRPVAECFQVQLKLF
ncbi:MAG: ribonuclease HII [Bacilli bacterium]|nr:ribonuclease HII [Bacilli bacterium]